MPSWPSRLHLTSPPNNLNTSRPKSSDNQSPPFRNSGPRSPPQDPPLHGVPVLHERTFTVSPAAKSRHERAYSHPFPSMFGSVRRGNRPSRVDVHNALPEDLENVPAGIGTIPFKEVSTNGTYQKDELRDGRCKTCDSPVRWPAHLDVFRCTVCLMVNDLEPLNKAGSRSIDAVNGTTHSAKPAPMKKIAKISLDTTRNLIDESLRLYLRPRIDQGLRNTARNLSQPSRQPHQDATTDFTKLNDSNIGPSGIRPPSTILPPSRAPPSPPNPELSVKSARGASTDNHDPESSRHMFRLLENYIVACFSNVECLNTSFLTRGTVIRAASESSATEKPNISRFEDFAASENPFPELDGKTLLLGDFAENGMWWTGRSPPDQHRSKSNAFRPPEEGTEELVTARNPRINWTDLREWYELVIHAGQHWEKNLRVIAKLGQDDGSEDNSSELISAEILNEISNEVSEACIHVQKALMKATEKLLLRPGRPLKNPDDCRFLLILLSNPLLYASDSTILSPQNAAATEKIEHYNRKSSTAILNGASHGQVGPTTKGTYSRAGAAGRHSGVIKRLLGLLANLPVKCHQRLVSWFSRLSEAHLRSLVDLIGRFVTYRLARQHGRKRSDSHDPMGGLIPSMSGPGAGTPAHLHAALGVSQTSKNTDKPDSSIAYADDWQIKAAARIMSLLFTANVQGLTRFHEVNGTLKNEPGRPKAASAARNRAHRHGQILPTNAFYNTLLDYSDLIADFEAWESRKGKFSFCQYPMFLSIWAKIRIMEHDARRQMEIKAREAFFESIMSRKDVNQYLVLKVRRDCLVDDSLRSVSEVVGQGPEEIKKGLRIEFKGEEGLDSGGLRKEWFLLLVREVFDPDHGLFVYDEESQYCYFNPNTFETSDQFFLIGVLLGLAIYNSTILDVALPPFTFRKLLAGAPNYTGPTTTSIRPVPGYALEDLAEFRPSLAYGLKQLLDFEGDVKETFALDFVVDIERYGHHEQVALCPDGQNKPVTNSNRREFVDQYIRYLLDTSVARQYEPFKRGFFTVCGGHALALFRPEEIELLIRGSDEPLDVPTLRTVAVYENWNKGKSAADEPIVDWFWDTFAKANPADQRRLLSFITSSDRIPAMGTTSLVIKIVCLGDSNTRFPIARTCFNMLGLYRYRDREMLEDKLWRAVEGSEGFGMK